MKTRYLYLVYMAMSVIDILITNFAFIVAFSHSNFGVNSFTSQLVVANYIWVFTAIYFGLYNRKFLHSQRNSYTLTFKSLTLFSILFTPYILLSKGSADVISSTLLFYIIMFLCMTVNSYLYFLSEKLFKKHFKIARSVAVIGNNPMALRLAGFFKERDSYFAFEGFLDQHSTSYLDAHGQVLPSIVGQLKSAADSGIKDIYMSLSTDRIHEFELLQKQAEKNCLRLKLIPDMSESMVNHLKLSYMGEFSVLSHRHEPLEEIENRVKKRLFDLIFSSLVIVFIISWLYPIIGLIIKLQSPGPILFKQLRSGKDNKDFVCYKFRSMRMNAGEKQATINDDRITPIGRFLRKTSLDELPQFFNVFLGEMSVVGPRPHILTHTSEYSQIINQYMVRHFLKSGITGWAQVSGYRGETKDPTLMQKRVEHDIWYLENWSMLLDLKIIFMTVFHVINGDENAY
ncbi:exopolysaccharide biosynthesis polyprenyl glycosylphosphotransferase [Mucilaginibacter pallidiroseus]|uniref:Exopolysaccharide biosynthesis polyprenyl glycosylphosphotransferase n=1 Tax=Mucilaginibacter pallidiroseus TaxID=2599295 RepID=A0A563UBV7_9SPHI|nr:exopolysaccharide biosynthesis polyprenyl glycosylphosphotransferase [Mucilaginibacter pallidiroseus]TWR28847.1 exopolysaccharide biosynthesis polyprenyl glycosylphosphotransferase [Mucilaginibacter pallidiroseus]